MVSVPLTRSVRVGYGLGSFCTGTFATVPGLLLLYYMTNVLAVPPGLAGLAIFLPKAWDLVINTWVGRRSDRTVSKYGPRRPWLLVGTVGGYRIMGMVIAGVLLVAMIGTFARTAKAPYIARVEAVPSTLREQLVAARSNRSFLLLLGLGCVQMLAAGTMLAGAPYFATYVLENPNAVTTLFVALVGPLVLTMSLWVRIARRYDKRGGMVLASSLFLVGGVALAFTPQFGALYAHICVVVVGIGYAGLQMLQYSMLADTLIADTLESGVRRTGVLTGLWTAAETVVFAFGAQMLAWMLALGGFVSSEPDHPVAQPQSAINAVLIGGSALPALLVSVAIVLTLRYDVTAEQLAELRARAAGRTDRLE